MLLAALVLLQWESCGCNCAMHRVQRWTAAMQFDTAAACAVCNCCFCSRLSLQNTRQVCLTTLALDEKSARAKQTLPICAAVMEL
jgi:hypothetical protein